MKNEKNKGKTEKELHDRDKDEYKKGTSGKSKDHPWEYKGVCYADHITK